MKEDHVISQCRRRTYRARHLPLTASEGVPALTLHLRYRPPNLARHIDLLFCISEAHMEVRVGGTQRASSGGSPRLVLYM